MDTHSFYQGVLHELTKRAAALAPQPPIKKKISPWLAKTAGAAAPGANVLNAPKPAPPAPPAPPKVAPTPETTPQVSVNDRFLGEVENRGFNYPQDYTTGKGWENPTLLAAGNAANNGTVAADIGAGLARTSLARGGAQAALSTLGPTTSTLAKTLGGKALGIAGKALAPANAIMDAYNIESQPEVYNKAWEDVGLNPTAASGMKHLTAGASAALPYMGPWGWGGLAVNAAVQEKIHLNDLARRGLVDSSQDLSNHLMNWHDAYRSGIPTEQNAAKETMQRYFQLGPYAPKNGDLPKMQKNVQSLNDNSYGVNSPVTSHLYDRVRQEYGI